MTSRISQQIQIIETITAQPNLTAFAVHNSENLPSDIISIAPPFISHNDASMCCILHAIRGTIAESMCEDINVRALGPTGKVGVPYLLTRDNQTLIVKVSEVDAPYTKYQEKPPTSLNKLNIVGVRACLTKVPVQNIRYMVSDEFTNETLIAYVLNYLASKVSLPPLFVIHHDAGVCTDQGVTYGMNIMEYCDLGPLDEFVPAYAIQSNITYRGRTQRIKIASENDVYAVLTQLTVALDMLESNIGFTSGDLKAGNVFVKSDAIDYEYKGIHLQAPFTCKIGDYGKSSCMIRRSTGTALRFYTDSKLARAYLKIHPFDPNIQEYDGVMYYTLGTLTNLQLATRTRHMGIPFYMSMDYYTILVSLLTRPAYFYTFFSSEKLLSTFWQPVWNPNESSQDLIDMIYNYVLDNSGRSINDALNMLKGRSLRCDAVTAVMKKLQH